MKQNNQSSWAARLRKFSALCLMLLASANLWAANELTVKPNVKAGDTGTITIALDNATAYTAFQMDIKLPEGLSIADNGAMNIVSAVNADHQLKYNKVDGVIKVAAFSFDGASNGNEAFKESGDLLIIDVTADANYKPADVEISNIKFVTYSELTLVETFTVVNEQGEELLMGDVNSDGVVDTQDALLIIDKWIGVDNENFNASAADLNSDNLIDTQDALIVIDIWINK